MMKSRASAPAPASAFIAAALLAAAPPPAAADEHDGAMGLLAAGFEYFGRAIVQSAAMAVRSQMEMTYGDIFVDIRSGALAVTDIRALPETPFAEPGACVVTIGRLELAGASVGDFGEARIELTDIEIAPECLPEEPRGMAAALGYETLGLEVASIDYDYDVGSSALNATINAALTDVAEIQARVELSYFWVAFDSGMNPEGLDGPPSPGAPVADLAFAEILIADAGGLERARPMIEGMVGDINALPPMAEGGVIAALSDGGASQVTPAQTAFAADLRKAAEGLLAGTGDLVLTVAPAEPVRIDPDLFGAPAAVFAALSPSASGRVAARRGLIPADLLIAAFEAESGISDEDRMAVGRALATGVGAPFAPELGRSVLSPLIEQAWNGEAAMIAAQSLAAANELDAYGYALVACAGGAPGAQALAETLEARLSAADILGVQQEARNLWPGAEASEQIIAEAIAAGDIAAIRGAAKAAARGDARPRDHIAAYRYASLAAAAGDRAAAALRDRIARRYSARSGADAADWAAAAREAEAGILAIWVADGLAERLAAE